MNKALLQQALDALRASNRLAHFAYAFEEATATNAAITALEAALAQPEQKPLGYVYGNVREFIHSNRRPEIFSESGYTKDAMLPVYLGPCIGDAPKVASPPIAALSDEEISEISASIVREVCELDIAKPFDLADDEVIVTVCQLRFICINEIEAALLKKAGA
jgi:hypothetical protein